MTTAPKPTPQRAHDAKRLAQGYRRVVVWLSPDDLSRLAQIKRGEAVSDPEAIRSAIAYAVS